MAIWVEPLTAQSNAYDELMMVPEKTRTQPRTRFLYVGLSIIPAMMFVCPAVAQNRVTILNDAFGRSSALEQDWGYSALIEFEGKRILFDTGGNAALFQRNVERLHVDLSHLDMVIISHAHGDHTSGLRYVLSRNPTVPLYVPDDPFFTGSTLPASFLETDARPELPTEMRYFGGKARPQSKGWVAWSGTKMTVVSSNISIAPHIRLVSLVSDKAAFQGLREISLVLETQTGLVIVAGCSHTDILNIFAAATVSDSVTPVHMLFGGLHLLQDSAAQIDHTFDVLSEKYHLRQIGIGHCTGELAFEKAKDRWGKEYLYAGLGEVLEFGVKPF